MFALCGPALDPFLLQTLTLSHFCLTAMVQYVQTHHLQHKPAHRRDRLLCEQAGPQQSVQEQEQDLNPKKERACAACQWPERTRTLSSTYP